MGLLPPLFFECRGAPNLQPPKRTEALASTFSELARTETISAADGKQRGAETDDLGARAVPVTHGYIRRRALTVER
jgi:hypothetical protein